MIRWQGSTDKGDTFLRATTPVNAIVRDYNDADEHRPGFLWWAIYYEGPFMPATRQGWERTHEQAVTAATAALFADGVEVWR